MHLPTALLLATLSSPPAAEAAPPATPPSDDPYLWLEDVTGDKALDWVRARNKVSQGELEAAPGFTPLRDRLKSILDSKEKIAFPSVMGAYIYNFWKDDEHPRGIWRRTSLAEFKKPQPKWEIVIDVDALGKAEGESWVWHGANCLFPKYEKCLVSLSRGGADADVVREFDAKKKAWVKDGFSVPEAKTDVAWKDANTIYVGTNFGEGSLTDSGYPRITKEWKRGTPLSAATTVYEGKQTDVAVSGWREFDHGKVRDWVGRNPSFFTDERYLVVGGKLEKIENVTLRSDWKIGDKTWPAGALLVIGLDDYRKGKRDFTMLYEPKPNTGLDGYTGTKTGIFVVELEDVKSRLYVHTRGKQGWQRAAVPAPEVGSFNVDAFDEDKNDDYWFTDTGFLTPATLSLGSLGKPDRLKLRSEPSFFKADGLVVTQHFAKSKDGTKVPYFQISKGDLALDGKNPTILEGYGGFEISLTPVYAGGRGAAWLERGGVHVVANIRGGGEYGPKWHQAALTHNRQRAYDDFIAVAQDLLARKVTSTPKLGIVGGSNGGLLMGVMLTQRPDLFGAVVCQVPLLDMKRYHKLLAGASWMEEYGDPDKREDWAALAKFSPYQNVKAGVRYPRTLFVTSTRDDRVHPGHARKMVARLLENKADLLYYENIEGGHGGAADNGQRAYLWALTYSFFAGQLGLN
jgi:prolyl oligopeptidase